MKAARLAARRAKRALLRLAGEPLAALVEAALRRTSLRAGLAVVYHRVGDPSPDPDDELNPTVGVALLEEQLDHLARRYRPVRARELHEAVRARRRSERFPVAVTFDDDLPSHARDALTSLRRAGVPGAFFLCGASLERPFAFWWERLQAAHDGGIRVEPRPGARGDDIHAVAAAVEELSPQDRDAFAARLGDAVGADPPEAGMRADDVRCVVEGGQDVGFHTRRHDPLPALDDDSLSRALLDGRDELAAAARTELDSIAYPHGRADARVARAARDAGYRAGFTTTGRAVRADDDPLLLSRVDVPFDSTGSLALRLARALLRRYGQRP